MITLKIKETLEKQGYRLVGKHSGVKICLWCKHSLRGKGNCYKNTFYGIQSHRCVQMSPALINCSNRCIFCWRDLRFTHPHEVENPDSPKEIVDGCIEEQKKLLQGFKGNPEVDKKKFDEAMEPRHFALSLSGDATWYPRLSELLEEIHSRGMTSFLVTNGQLPEKIADLKTLPTQLYISVDAPSKEIFEEVNRPLFKDGWERLLKSLEIMAGLKCRRVLRLTLVKGMNICEPENYAKLARIANPDFIEVKAYMLVGYSRERLKMENMPSHEEVRAFSEDLAKELGWKVVDEKKGSRVCLIMKEDSKERFFDLD